jgi:hypothetical protein
MLSKLNTWALLLIAFILAAGIGGGAEIMIHPRHYPIGPRLAITPTMIDLGMIDQGASAKGTFNVESVGAETVQIVKVSANCGCTLVEPRKKRLAPGETTIVDVTFNSTGYWRRFVKQVMVQSNDTLHPNIVVGLTGYVRTGVRLESNTVDLGKACFAGDVSGKLVVYRDPGQEVEGLSVKGTPDDLIPEIGPWKAAGDLESATIEFKVASIQDTVGAHQRQATLVVGNQEFPITLTYDVIPTVVCEPTQAYISLKSDGTHFLHLSWNGSTPRFGEIRSSDGKCRGKITNLAERGCDLAITKATTVDGADFDILHVVYTLGDGGRREVINIPVIFTSDTQ